MTYSLNEVETTAKRAAHGAGYPWGLAEEAGKAARWLVVQNIDGAAILAKVLVQELAGELDEHVPERAGSVWKGEAELCPLAAGALVSDAATCLTHEPMRLEAVLMPILIVPFAANAACRLGGTVRVIAGGAEAATDGSGLEIRGAFPRAATDVTLCLEDGRPIPCAGATRALPDAGAWSALETLAFRTYAPATEESRRLGAGPVDTE